MNKDKLVKCNLVHYFKAGEVVCNCGEIVRGHDHELVCRDGRIGCDGCAAEILQNAFTVSYTLEVVSSKIEPLEKALKSLKEQTN